MGMTSAYPSSSAAVVSRRSAAAGSAAQSGPSAVQDCALSEAASEKSAVSAEADATPGSGVVESDGSA
jgi:hypothetical protein